MVKKSVEQLVTRTLLLAVVLLVVAVIMRLSYYGYFIDSTRRQPSCASNMKEIWLGMIQYAQDYDDKWPGGSDHWAGEIYSYEKEPYIYRCAEDPRTVSASFPLSYAMNGNLRGASQEDLTKPDGTVLAIDFDATAWNFTQPERISAYTNGTTHDRAWGGVRLGSKGETRYACRHKDSVNVLTCDGHVHSFRPEQVSGGMDNLLSAGKQDPTHAAGANAQNFGATFSER